MMPKKTELPFTPVETVFFFKNPASKTPTSSSASQTLRMWQPLPEASAGSPCHCSSSNRNEIGCGPPVP